MQRSTDLLQRRARSDGIEPATTGMGQATTGSLFGGGSMFDSSFDLGFGSNFDSSFNFGSGFDSNFDFGSGPNFGFDTGGGFGSGLNFGQISPTSFDASLLNQNVFGQNAPFSQGVPLRQGEPTQEKVPEFDDWKQFVGFLFKNGPAWVRAFQGGRIRSPAQSPTGDQTIQQRRAMLYRALQQTNNPNQYLNDGGAILSGMSGILLLGGLALGGVLLVAATSGGGRTVIRAPRRAAPGGDGD